MPRPDLSDSDHPRGLLDDPRSPFLERDLRQLRSRFMQAAAAELVASARSALVRALKANSRPLSPLSPRGGVVARPHILPSSALRSLPRNVGGWRLLNLVRWSW